MARKRKVWEKINLLETSVVGIPAYPDAHLSFIKALEGTDKEEEDSEAEEFDFEDEDSEEVLDGAQVMQPKLNLENKMESEIVKQEAEVKEVKEETVVKTEVSEIVEKQLNETQVKEIVAKSLQEALDKLSVNRGLVETDKAVKDMSVGELALKSGLFQIPN